MSATIRLDRQSLGEGWVAWVAIDKPDPGNLNIIGSPEMEQLAGVLDDLASAPDLRAMVLTGGGERAFIGGANIHEMAGLRPSTAREFISALHGVCERLRSISVPVIARIQGFCLGAGLEIAAACDLRVASDDATFGMPEVKVGIPSVIEAALLPRLIGIGKARELVMTGRTMDADEALRCGLVERVAPASALDAAVEAWLGDIAQCGPDALAAQKVLCRAWEEQPLSAAIDTGIDHFARAFEGEEPARMLNGFLDRKRPG